MLNIDNEVKILTAFRTEGTEVKILGSVPVATAGDLAEAKDFITEIIRADMILNTKVEQKGDWEDLVDFETKEFQASFVETSDSEVFYEIQISSLLG
jgi:hypothetical protein